jgi:PIN domain nuclease of toxin-antitoxin system
LGGVEVILLDTCTLLWLANDELPPGVASIVADDDHALFVSAISAWEIGVKHSLGKLPLRMAPPDWWGALVARYGLREVPVEVEIALRSASLPAIHSDPADRILVATAMHLGATILTPDPRTRAYPGVKVSWA